MLAAGLQNGGSGASSASEPWLRIVIGSLICKGGSRLLGSVALSQRSVVLVPRQASSRVRASAIWRSSQVSRNSVRVFGWTQITRRLPPCAAVRLAAPTSALGPAESMKPTWSRSATSGPPAVSSNSCSRSRVAVEISISRRQSRSHSPVRAGPDGQCLARGQPPTRPGRCPARAAATSSTAPRSCLQPEAPARHAAVETPAATRPPRPALNTTRSAPAARRSAGDGLAGCRRSA